MTPAKILGHLGKLVACDTQNPPREIDGSHPVFEYVNAVLAQAGGFSVDIQDHGKGRVALLATRGEPGILFNVHLDTVPVGAGWTRPPLELTVEGSRAYGRGSCDIKGAAAVLLAIIESSDLPVGILFSTDEEGGEGCCVARFCESLAADRFEVIVVSEPTGCKAVLEHRGYLSVLGEFHGETGHSSAPRALVDNANHKAALWAAAAIAYAADEESLGRGLCFNLGVMAGGTSSNVIAAKTKVHWSARLPPGGDTDSTLLRVCGITEASQKADWHARFSGLPLSANVAGRGSHNFCAKHDLEIGQPVDYWTEASLFAAAGHPAIVLGPGDIEQAHTADEWVGIDQLLRASTVYERLLQETCG